MNVLWDVKQSGKLYEPIKSFHKQYFILYINPNKSKILNIYKSYKLYQLNKIKKEVRKV